MSTTLRNFVQIGLAVSFPRMRDFAHQIVYGATFVGFFVPPTHSEDAITDIDAKYAKRRCSAQGCAFFGCKIKTWHLHPMFPRNRNFGARFRRYSEIFAWEQL